MNKSAKPHNETKAELRRQLEEALQALDAIRTGQVDALVVHDGGKHELYTLHTADRAYRAFIENMSEGAVNLHNDGTIDYANTQFAELLDRPLTDIIGHPFTEFVAVDNQNVLPQLFAECMLNHECRREIELIAGKRRIPVLVSLTVLHVDETNSFPMIVTDLREQKKVQRKLEEQNRALLSSNYDLQQFASAAAHDLQEPLRKISTFANLLLTQNVAVSSERMTKYLEKIGTSAGRMRQLIIDVLAFSKLSGTADKFIPTDLRKVVSNLLEDFELEIEQKKAVIHVGPLPVICVQPIQIAQAMRNLLSNALKFNRPGVIPEVWISSIIVESAAMGSPEHPQGTHCRLYIRDNGIGFDEAYLDKIFGLFQRLHSHDAYEGTGIGLAITKKIVEQHNGIIEASSHLNKGSEFRILLPMRQQTRKPE